MTKKNLSLDQAFHDLEQLVTEFEQGEVDLEKSIEKFKEGLELAKFLKEKLAVMTNQIQELKVDYQASETKTQKNSAAATSPDLKTAATDDELPF